MGESEADHLVVPKQIFETEQQETFFRMLRRRSGCASHGPAMGMGLGSGPPMQERCKGHSAAREAP